MKCPNCNTELKATLKIELPTSRSIEHVIRQIRDLEKDGKKRNIYLVDKSNPKEYLVTYAHGFTRISKSAIDAGLASGLIRQVEGYPTMQYFEIV